MGGFLAGGGDLPIGGGGDFGGGGFPPIGGAGGPTSGGISLTPVTYTGTIREWPQGTIPRDLQPYLFAPPAGYAGPFQIGTPDGMATLIFPPLDYPGGPSQFAIDWKKVATWAELILFFIKASALIGGQLFQLTAAPSGGGSTEQTGNAAVNVVVNDVNTVTDATIASIAAAVSGAVAASSRIASAMAARSEQATSGALQATTSALNGFVGQFEQGIPALFSNLVTGFLAPVNTVQQSIAGDVSSVSSLVNEITSNVLAPIGGLVAGLQPGLAGIEQTISGQLGTLGGDIGKLLTGFQSGIPDAVNGVEKVLERIAGIWSDVHSTLNLGDIHADLKRLGDEIAGIAGKKIDTVFRPIDLINETCDVAKYDEQVKASKDSVDSLDQPWKGLANIGMYVFLQAARLLATVEQVKKIGEESINQNCPVTKIDPGTVVSLWRRGILNEESARKELLFQGYNPDRQKVLYDGTAFLESPGIALDYWYRHIASDDDLRGILLSNGFSVAQVEAFKAASVQLGAPQDALRGWLYGLLDEGEVDKVLNANRYDNAQIELIKAISRRPATANETLEGENARAALGAFSLPAIFGLGTDWDTVPQWFTDAAKSEGLSAEAIQQRWWAHWNITPPSTAIQQFFRGIRSLAETRTILDRFYIPSTMQQDLINVSRPLIPFRTIPAMLANGVINMDEARHLLEQHGFDEISIDKLIHYSQLSKPKASTAAATTAHATSIASARSLYEDGAITEQQYSDVLAEHGLLQSAIDAEIQVAGVQQTLRERKQAGADIVNEYQAGLLTLDQAKQQLAQLNFTIAEQARYLKQLRTAKTAVAKIPGEADLNHFLQLSIITADQYAAALEAQGYSSEWAQAFLAWRVKPTTPTPATP